MFWKLGKVGMGCLQWSLSTKIWLCETQAANIKQAMVIYFHRVCVCVHACLYVRLKLLFLSCIVQKISTDKPLSVALNVVSLALVVVLTVPLPWLSQLRQMMSLLL